MSASIHQLHAAPSKVGGFLRVGHNGHRKIEALHASGRFAFDRVVFDASHIAEQASLVQMLSASGLETILDPNFAEMASAGRYQSAVKRLPWANTDRPWEPTDFVRARNMSIAQSVAEFAIAHRVSAVLAPTHLISDHISDWHRIDLELCERLRHELDRAGGQHIGIDFQLITTAALLQDEPSRNAIVANIHELPVQNLWLRVSGFGATATGVGTRHFIQVVRNLHEIGRPIVGDAVGGYAGLAALAFGAVGAICHGLGVKESFRASDWTRPPPPPRDNGTPMPIRVYVPELDRSFTKEQLDGLFAARGGRAAFCCNDSSCCAHGADDMRENSHAHFVTQRSRQLADLNRVPDSRRVEHFLLRHLDPATKAARLGAKLKIPDEKLFKAVQDAGKRLGRFRDALGDLHRNTVEASRSRATVFRGSVRSLSAAVGQ